MKNYLKAFRAKTEKKADFRSVKFFTEDNINGAISKLGFQEYIISSSDSELDHLDTILEATSQGANINSVLKPTFDKIDGHQIVWFNLRMPKSELPALRIQYDEGIMRFFQSYQRGSLRFNFKLRDLMAESGLEVEEE
jgi:hypothetical protein